MMINDELRKKHMSMYRLSKESGVPQATISDICSRKTSLAKCAAGTVWRIARALGVTVEDLLSAEYERDKKEERPDFEIFKGNACHRLKRMGDLDFILDILESNEIVELYKKRWYPEAYYMLAMLDYLSKENDVPLCTDYDELRDQRLSKPIYPASVIALSAAEQSDQAKREARKGAIPEFVKYNIIEGDIRGVV